MAASASDAHPYPIYNARFRVTFPILDADGDLVTGAASLDSELSQDSGTFADATNEATEIATSSGMYFLDLIATELDTKSTAIIVKTTTSGAKTTPLVLYPRRLPVIRTGTAQAGGASSITLDSSASAIDDYYTGAIVNITNDSPSNARGQARKITAYVGSTKVATVEGTYGTNPSSASTFEVLGTEEWAWRLADLRAAGGVATTQTGGRPEVNTTHAAGTAWASGAITAAVIATDAIDADAIADNAINAAAIAADAITAAKIADGAIDAATFAAGAINAAAIATNAIDADALAADAVAEIADGVWDEDATGHQTQGSFGQVLGDSGADSDTLWGLVNANLDATVSSRASSAQATNIQADTDDLQTRLPAALVGGRMDSSVGAMAANTLTASALAADAVTEIQAAILSDATPFAGANLNATISSRATPAQVNAEVLDVLNVDTFALPGQTAPPLAPTLVQVLTWLFKNFRNRKTQTATQWSLMADNETTVDAKATVSDDGTTATKQEIVSGP